MFRPKFDANVVLVCCAVVLSAGLVAFGLRSRSEPAPPRVADEAKAAAVDYFHELAAVYRGLAQSPPATVREAAERAAGEDQRLRDAFKSRMTNVMRPRIGDDALDPAAAKGLFDELADGFAAVR